MKLLLILIIAAIGQTAFSQTAVQFSPMNRKLLEATPIDFSWTNRITVTQIDKFPICGHLTTPLFAQYDSTNYPNFILLENGIAILKFDFRPLDKKTVMPNDFSLSFHINQWGNLRNKFDAFNSYQLTMAENHVFPISLSLGEVRPDPYDTSSTHYFRFTIHASAQERVTLLVETGERSSMGGSPDNYRLQILDEKQARDVMKMLDGLPTPMWWGQKATGIISSMPNK